MSEKYSLQISEQLFATR